MLLTGIAFGVLLGLLIVIFSTSRNVEYIETLHINGSPETVFASIAYQENLMQWSAWPSVLLHFRNKFPWGVHVLVRLFGIVRWTRKMHLKDLAGLERFVENNETYEGQPAKQVKAV